MISSIAPLPAPKTSKSKRSFVLFLFLLLPIFAQSQEVPKVEDRESEPATQHEMQVEQDRLNGISPEERRQIDDWLQRHPGMSESDYRREKTYQARLAGTQEFIQNQGKSLLSPPDARGWAYQATWFVVEPGHVVRAVTAEAYHGSLGGPSSGFLIVQSGGHGPTESPVSANTIRMARSEAPSAKDLGRFFQVNNQVLKDIGLHAAQSPTEAAIDAEVSRELAVKIPTAKAASPAYPNLAHSQATVVTGARVSGTEEIVTIFNLSDSAQTGALSGDMYTLSVPDPERQNANVSPINGSPGANQRSIKDEITDRLKGKVPGKKRVYFYGDALTQIDLAETVEQLGYEFIRRSPKAPRNLLESDRRIEQIAKRPLDQSKLTVVNGLPQTAEVVVAMGALVGDPQLWLNFRTEVEENLRGHTTNAIADSEGFLRELTEGDSDILILIAHSSGAYLYLNGQKLPLHELQQLPKRERPSDRPRLAILITCDAGRGTAQGGSSNSGLWSRLINRDIVPLAQVLVDHGWVDKVIAPDHRIQPNESIAVLQRALEGAPANSIFKNWVTWALQFAETTEPTT